MLNHPFLIRYNWIYFLLSAFLLTCFMGIMIHQTGKTDLETALTDAAVSMTFLAMLAIFVVNTMAYYHPLRFIYLFMLFSATLCSVVWTLGVDILLSWIYPEENVADMISSTLWMRLSFSFTIFTGIIMYGWQNYRIKELDAVIERQDQTEQSVKDAELFKLRQQLQPHFLFNSLNSINALIMKKPEQARMMVLHLSEFLRGTLKKEDKKYIPLCEELEYLRLYLEIEQVRFGHRLNSEMQVSEEAQQTEVPPLVLQPIMENAIKFGLYGTIGEVKILLKAHTDTEYLHVMVSNPFEDETSIIKGTGFGLESVTRRLYLLYARNDLLQTNKENGSFTVTIKFPLNHD